MHLVEQRGISAYYSILDREKLFTFMIYLAYIDQI